MLHNKVIKTYQNGDAFLRPTWDEEFMLMAMVASERSSCFARQVGAVIVQNNQIISTGYNGAPSGVKSCIKRKHCYLKEKKFPLRINQIRNKVNKQIRDNPELYSLSTSAKKKIIQMVTEEARPGFYRFCLAQHAEANALSQAGKSGIPLAGATIYVTLFPCQDCAKDIITAGIKRIVYVMKYESTRTADNINLFTRSLLDEKGVEVSYIQIRKEAKENFAHKISTGDDISKSRED